MSMDNNSSFGCFGMLLALIIGGFLALFVGTSQTVTSPPVPNDPTIIEGQGGGGETFQSLTVIERVDVVAADTHFEVNASGYQPDGCEFPVVVEQSISGNQIDIRIYRDIPLTVLCTQMLVLYQDTIRVEGPFAAGTYSITVNGTTVEVTV